MLTLGACGLKCSECNAFKATQANDTEKLAELAKSWGSPENPYTVEDMRCNGCMSDVTYKGCASCGVRNSALEHSVSHCGECSEFACDKLTSQWANMSVKPEAMRANLGKP